MAIVYGRRPIKNTDGEFYMAEIGPSYVYRIPPDDISGHSTYDACVKSYFEYLVSTAELVELRVVDEKFVPILDYNEQVAQATHLLKFKTVNKAILYNPDAFTSEHVVAFLMDNPQEYIF